MSEYVPTDMDVREDFAYPWEGFVQDRPGRLAAFDRWLAAHDAKVRASALHDAADAMAHEKGATFADALMIRWLEDRADALARPRGAHA